MSYLAYLPSRIRSSQYFVDRFVELADFYLSSASDSEKDAFRRRQFRRMNAESGTHVVGGLSVPAHFAEASVIFSWFGRWEENKHKLPNTWLDHGVISADPDYVWRPSQRLQRAIAMVAARRAGNNANLSPRS